MTDRTMTEARVQRAHLGLTTGVAALSGVALLVLMAVSVGDLPDQLATHFNFSGQADGHLPRWVALVLFAVLAIGTPALVILVFAALKWWCGSGARAFSGFLAGLAVSMSVSFGGIILANRGAASPAEVHLGGWVLPIALAAGIVVGVIVALVLPQGLPPQASAPVSPVELAPTERASWFGRARSGTGLLAVLAVAMLVLVVATVTSGQWWLWLVVLAVALLVLAVVSFTVRVDASGVTWRSALGLPRGHVPMESITDVAVTEVAVADFGGFGLRVNPRGMGLITCRGPALEVTHGGRRLVATVDDPEGAAGLLLGYLKARQH